MAAVDFLELEITGRCQLACRHCYADSGRHGTHGTMTPDDWRDVIDQAAALDIDMVQFIGGEPTLHPNFTELLRYALDAGRRVEVFTNLVRVKETCWELFTNPGVSLATSYYSDAPAGHEQVTGRRGSHARTRANIAEAVRRSIPVRVGIIDIFDGQRVDQARAELGEMGVTEVGVDRLRGVGRGSKTRPDLSQLCGWCGRGKAAISADGDVWPCVLARWMTPAGNVKRADLGAILEGPRMAEVVASIPKPVANCSPDKTGCKPKEEGSDCQPAEKPACKPKY